MNYRTEHDSMGEVKVPENALWGAQTQRSLENFTIGAEKMPKEVIYALSLVKLACATVNNKLLPEKMTNEKLDAITGAANEIIGGKLDGDFPLSVWQTGSGTQTNMNVNEVIANYGNKTSGKKLLHPNDDVNMSQSSNDVFPTAMHISAVISTENKLLVSLKNLIEAFKKLEKENEGIIKTGRTHLQDATPLKFSQEISGWRASLEKDAEMINLSLKPLRELAIGGTAVGTGINCPAGFDKAVAKELSSLTNTELFACENKFHALSSKDELVFAHGALKALAGDLMKIANDIRWLSSGPRCGLGEITIPANEPGSSIMPGKVNPTQCEAVTMVAVQVMGNDAAVGFAASQGNFELNVFMPVIIYNYLQSVNLLADACASFEKNCARGIYANREKMNENLNKSLMTATALNTVIGYENTAKVVKKAYEENLTLKQAAVSSGLLSEQEFDKYYNLEKMV